MKPGVYTMPAKEYHADPCVAPSLSSHIANVLISQSPRHAAFAHPRLNPNYHAEESTDFDLGACAHAVLLEGEGNIYPIEAPDWRTKAAKDARDQARAEGKTPILAHKLGPIRAMADAARLALAECELGPIDLGTGVAEQVLIWQEGDVWCRARPDWMSPALTVDYKSTAGSAEPSAWIRNQMGPMAFDLQAVHYSRGRAMAGGIAVPKPFIFLVQENYEPYECSFVGMSPAMTEVAQRKWDFAIALWKNCLQKNRWSGYSRQVAYADPTSWQIADAEERALSFDELLERASA